MWPLSTESARYNSHLFELFRRKIGMQSPEIDSRRQLLLVPELFQWKCALSLWETFCEGAWWAAFSKSTGYFVIMTTNFCKIPGDATSVGHSFHSGNKAINCSGSLYFSTTVQLPFLPSQYLNINFQLLPPQMCTDLVAVSNEWVDGVDSDHTQSASPASTRTVSRSVSFK